MDQMICGHERDVLIWALTDAKRRSAGSVATLKGLRLKNNYQQAIVDVNDPAKLAEMLVEVGRRLGFDARCCVGFGIPKHRDEMTVIWHDDCQVVEVWCHRWHTFTMPTAIDVLAAWIRLPEGFIEEAKQVLAQYNQQTRRP